MPLVEIIFSTIFKNMSVFGRWRRINL